MPSGIETSVTMHVFRRRWVRCEPPRWPFVWRGLLPVLGLIALAIYAAVPFARIEIQANVRAATRAALDEQGFDWVDVAVSGQDVWLSGVQPAAGAGRSRWALRVASPAPAGPVGCVVP